MKFAKNSLFRIAAFATLLCGAIGANAEPYLAVREGFQCAQCHVNPTGGGLRNTFGNAYAQSQLAATRIDTGDFAWTGSISQLLAVGGNLRASASGVDVPKRSSTREFAVDQARLYLNFAVIPNRLSIYVDELVAPGAASNREAFVRYQSGSNLWSVKAGQMYLPFGLRLQDDSAFVRELSQINMTNPDTGVEFSWDPENWSAQLAVSNGSGGGAETNREKQFSLQGAYVRRQWRLGLAANHNDSEDADRSAVGLFAGLNTGPIAWLAEVDYVRDKGLAGGDRKLVAGLIEGNWLVRKGHNLKLTAEHLDPDNDVDEDEQARYSAVYEYTPIQYLQLRFGARDYYGIKQSPLQNRRAAFVELHGFF
jgi:hypothetical protein